MSKEINLKSKTEKNRTRDKNAKNLNLFNLKKGDSKDLSILKYLNVYYSTESNYCVFDNGLNDMLQRIHIWFDSQAIK